MIRDYESFEVERDMADALARTLNRVLDAIGAGLANHAAVWHDAELVLLRHQTLRRRQR